MAELVLIWSMPTRQAILSAVRSSRQATARLGKLLSSSPWDPEQVAQCLEHGALIEEVAIAYVERKSPHTRTVREAILLQDDHELLKLILPANPRGVAEWSYEAWLTKASGFRAPGCLSLLLDLHGLPADPDKQLALLRNAVRAGDGASVKHLLAAGVKADTIFHEEHPGQQCLLHETCDPDSVRHLIAAGTPMDFPDGRGIPPLGHLLSLIRFDTRREQALSAIDALLDAGCALETRRPDGSAWTALDTLAFETTVVPELVVRLAQADPVAARRCRPRSAVMALALLDSGVIEDPVALSARTYWQYFGYRTFAQDRPALETLFARGMPAPTIGQVSYSDMGRWLDIGIRCPEEEVSKLRRIAEEDSDMEGRETPSLSLLDDTERLARSQAVALTRQLEGATSPAMRRNPAGPRL